MDLTTPIDIEKINNTANQEQPKIAKLMMNNIRETFANFTRYPGNVRNSVDLLTFEEGSIMMPYDPDLQTEKKLGAIDKRSLTVDVGMFYIRDEVERYRATYLALLEDLTLSEKAKLPFESWYLQTITEVGLQDLWLLPYQGLKAATTNAVDITDGYLKKVADGIDDEDISVANGNLYELSDAAVDYTSASIIDELKAQFDLFPAKRKQFGVDIHIPYEYQRMYKDCYISTYPNVTDGDVPIDYLDGTNKKGKLIWESAMGDTKRVIMTVKSNLVYGVDQNTEFGKIIVFRKDSPYYVDATAKSVLGFQIRTFNKRDFNCNNLA